MSLVIIGIIVIILLFIFRKVFKILFFVGLIIILFLIMAAFSSSINGTGVLNTIHSGFQSIDNSNGVSELKNFVGNEFAEGINFLEGEFHNNISNSLNSFLNNELGLKGAFLGVGNYDSKSKLSLAEYKNSSYYYKQSFNKGNKYVYINGFFCERVDYSNNYNIYTPNIDGYNYKLVNDYGNNDFNGFASGNNSVTINGITYYKGINNNKIYFYGEIYGTKNVIIENLKENKINFKNGDSEVYIDDSEYTTLNNGNKFIKVNNEKYYFLSGSKLNQEKDYLNIDGTIYWKVKNKNSNTITINGINYDYKENSFLENLF